MKSKAILVVAAALAISSAAATAQNPPPKAAPPAASPAAAPISASQRAAVADLFDAIKLPQEIQTMPDSMIDSEIARNPSLQPFRDIMIAWLKKYMTWPAMEPELTKLYASTFTEAELKSMAAFYRSPAGLKSLQKMPEMMQRTAMIGAALGQPHADELKKQMTARSDELQKKSQGGTAAVPQPLPKTPTKKP